MKLEFFILLLILLSGKEPTCNAGEVDAAHWEKTGFVYRGSGFDPWVGKISWRRTWQPTLIFLPGESHEQRSLGDGWVTVHSVAKGQTQLKQHSTRNVRDIGGAAISIPRLWRSPGVGNGHPLQYSCLENSIDSTLGSQMSQKGLSD